MSKTSFADYLLSNIDYVVERICQRLGDLPKSPDREFIIQTEKNQKRLYRWVRGLINGMNGCQDLFLIDKKREMELVHLHSHGLEFLFHYYKIFQDVIRELAEKFWEEEKPDPLMLCLYLHDLSTILLKSYNFTASYHVKSHEKRIEKILHIRQTQEFHTQMLEDPLSKRELEVFKCIAGGHSDQDIADMLFVSKNTIRSHLKNIYRKLNVTSKVQAVSKAYQYKIIEI